MEMQFNFAHRLCNGRALSYKIDYTFPLPVSTRRTNHPELLTDNYVYLTHKNQRFSLVCHFFIYLVDLLWYETSQ